MQCPLLSFWAPGASSWSELSFTLHLPFFPPSSAAPSLPSPASRDLAPPEARATRAEPVLQPRRERSVSPVWPPPLPVAAGSAQGERPSALKPWPWERPLLIHQHRLSDGRKSQQGKSSRKTYTTPSLGRSLLEWKRIQQLLSFLPQGPPPFFQGPQGHKAATANGHWQPHKQLSTTLCPWGQLRTNKKALKYHSSLFL